jgi:hypothetical protein
VIHLFGGFRRGQFFDKVHVTWNLAGEDTLKFNLKVSYVKKIPSGLMLVMFRILGMTGGSES